MNAELRQSYRFCQRRARRATSNFYWSFWMLPRAKRRAMCALYAFSRQTDDLGDADESAEARRRRLEQWRDQLQVALEGRPEGRLWPALADTVQAFAIPHRHLLEIVDGVMMDLQPPHYATFDQLRHYCYHVAAAVGLACIHIWGFRDERARELAEACGTAFQLTNILRDLPEDVARQRVYLPREDLARFAYGVDDLAAGVVDDRFRALMEFEIGRAEQFYARAAALPEYLERDGQRAFAAMFAVYAALLDEVKRRQGDVFARPVRIGAWRKLRLLAGACRGRVDLPRAVAGEDHSSGPAPAPPPRRPAADKVVSK